MKHLTTIVLAVLVFAGLAAAIWISTPAAPPSPVPATFLEFVRSEVLGFEIRNPGGTVRFERDKADAALWRVAVNKSPVRASSERVEDLLNDLSRLAPKNYWKKDEVKAEERTKWGLDKPPVEVILRLQGRNLGAGFGIRTMEKQNVYAEKDGNGDVYVVPVTAVVPLETASAEGFREKRPVGFSAFEAQVLTLSRIDGMTASARKTGDSTWELTEPYTGPADPNGIDGLVGKAVNVEVAEFVADGALDLPKYGLDKPRARISVRRQGREKPLVLLLGGDAGNDRVYFMEEGEPSVYACGPELPNAVAKFDPAALRDRNLLRLGWAKVDSFEYADSSRTERNWKLLRVHERWDVEVPDRTPADTLLVEGLLDELRKAEVVRFLDGEDPAKHGLSDPATAPSKLSLVGVDEAGTRTLLLGRKDAEGRVPARLLPRKGEKDPPVVILEGAFLDRLEEGWLAFRSREVLRLDLGEVKGMGKKDQDGTALFLRQDNLWKAAPGGPEPDGNALSAALARLLTLNASGFEARTKEGLEKWGLGDPPAGPSITFVLQAAGGERREKTLVFGAEVEGGGRYARFADGDLVFRLPNTIVNGADVVPFWELVSARWAK